MFSQFFGQYLLDNQKITAEQFSSCMKYIKDNRVKLGLIAENEGLLTRNHANELNYLQMQTDKRFGDLAVEKGYLTEADVKREMRLDVEHRIKKFKKSYSIVSGCIEDNRINLKDRDGNTSYLECIKIKINQ